MRRCKHENTEHMMPGDTTTPDWLIAPFVAECEQLRCIDCGAWLSLGPAKDTPEVMIEIRAAEIAQIVEECDGPWDVPNIINHGNLNGWLDCGSTSLLSPEWQAGYLARVIAPHNEVKS